MEKYFSRIPNQKVTPSAERGKNTKQVEQAEASPKKRKRAKNSPRKLDAQINVENVLENVEADPGLRIPILDYPPNIREKHGIDVPDMNDTFVAQFRSQRRAHKKTNLHHYRVELFFEVIDLQLHELNGRFSEATTEQLLCLSCLNPDDAFVAFEKHKLLRLARFYPKEFSTLQLIELENQLGTYILDLKSSTSFNGLKGVSELAKKMVETKKDKVYPLVYLLLTLALILPVATASVERAFSAMNIIKTSLRNRMEDQWMNDNMVVYIEKDIVDQIDNETVIQRFQKMKNRRGQL